MAIVHVVERRKRAEYVPAVLGGAVVRLHAPQRQQHPALDLEFLLDGVEGLRPVARLLFAAADAAARGERVDVGADRLAVFRLLLGGGDDALVGRHAAHGEVEGRARHALALRVGPQAVDEIGEGLLRRRRPRDEKGKQHHAAGNRLHERSLDSWNRCYTRDTSPPPCRTMRPASSNSSRTMRTMAGEERDSRTRSSIDQGEGPSRATLRPRSAARGSAATGPSRSGSSIGRSNPRPTIGSSASITSLASVTMVAPCLMRPFTPSARGSSGEPGTAKTSRPCSPASRAVISEPERRAASTMMLPTDRPEMMRLWRGKSCARGSHVSGISDAAAPLGTISSPSGTCSAG